MVTSGSRVWATLFFLVVLVSGYLRAQSGDAVLREFSEGEQKAIRNACSTAGSAGSVQRYDCLRRQAAELREARRRPGFASEREEVSESNVAGPARPAQAPARGNKAPGSPRVRSIVPLPSEPATDARPPAESKPIPTPIPVPKASEEDDTLTRIFWTVVIATWILWKSRHSWAGALGVPSAVTQNDERVRGPHDTRRPSPTSQATVIFADRSNTAILNPRTTDPSGVRDAVTGQPLRPEQGLHQCTQCRMFYQTSSIELLERENGGRCIGCGSLVSRSAVSRAADRQARARVPEIITLANYRSRVDQFVVFEGRCIRVLTSRSGTAYAVMFEDGGWTEGFKLVIRTGFVSQVGGADFIRSLEGKTIRARGLITRSYMFGYEISITERSMLLEVWS